MVDGATRALTEPSLPDPPRGVLRRQLSLLGSVAVASALILATLGTVLFCLMGRCDVVAVVMALAVLGPSTCLLSVLAVWICVRKQRGPRKATETCVGYCALAGAANLPLLVLAIGLFTRSSLEHVLISLVLTTIVGIAAGAPLGALFGAAFRPIVRHGCRHDRSFEHRERNAGYCASWLLAVAVVCGSVAIFFALITTAGPSGAYVVAGACFAVAVPCVAVARAARSRSRRRRGWLEQVRNGEVEGWLVCAPDRVLSGAGPLGPVRRDAPPLRPLLTDDVPQARVLARVRQDPRGGAYRSGRVLEPVATI